MNSSPLRFILSMLALVGVFLQPSRVGAQPVSDDFNEGCGLLSSPWTFIDPRGDGDLQFTGVGTSSAFLELSVPAGVSHDVWASGNLAPRVMQMANDTDFEIEVKFESLPAVKYQGQGVIIEESPGEFLRFDFYSPGGSLKLFAASFVGGSPTLRVNQSIASGVPIYLRIRREGNQWTEFYSYDGQTWTTAGSFSHVLSVSSVGVFVFNHGSPASNSPAYTAAIDYFFNTASPVVLEDGDASPDCSSSVCGDGVTETGEECDHAGESPTCDTDCTAAVCGDGTLNASAGEQCDDGNTVAGDGCSASCVLETCGNGIVDPGEECDDGAGNSDTLADACRTDCTNAACGDGVTDTVETCDDAGESPTCDADCTAAVCGDGTLNASAAEQCDDGNAVGGDGCSAMCLVEAGAPVISAVQAIATQTTATITWTTDQPTSSRIDYGPTNAYGEGVYDYPALVTAHAVLLTELAPDTLYHYQVSSSNAGGETVFGGDATFVTSSADPILVGHWRLDEGSGLIASDDSGNGNSGSLVGPQWSSDTPDGSGFSLQFDGVDDLVDLGGLDVVGEPLTIALWFKANSFGSGARDKRLISKAVGTASNDHFWMVSTIASGNTTRLRYRLRTNGVTKTLIASSGDLSTDVWTHVAAVYDGSMMRLYKDGVEVGSTAKSGLPDTDPTVSAAIGNQPTGAGAKSFAGVIDDVRMYEQALSPVEIQVLAIDTTVPEITEVQVTVGSSAATIRWTTNEPATSSVAYGPSDLYEDGTVDFSAFVTDHAILLTGLQATMTYHFEVTSVNENQLAGASEDFTFQTAFESVGPAGVQSDDFSRNNLDTTLWTLVDPLADSSLVVQGIGTPDATIHLAVPSGTPHDLEAGGISAPRILQRVNDLDFEIEAKFESGLGQANRVQGILIQEGPDRFLELSFYSQDSSLFLFAASYADGVGTAHSDFAIATAAPLFMRVVRQGDVWTQFYSGNGLDWSAGAVFTHPMVVNSVGVFAGNMGAAPAHTAIVDYFYNTGDPIIPEDGAVDQDTLPPLLQLVQSVAGDVWAEITWVTDEPADSEVFYGLTSSYELGSVFDAAFDQDHTLILPNLMEGTSYYFQVVSQDLLGQSAAAPGSTVTTHLSGGPLFDVWYGSNQRFGLTGTPQPWVNILGNVFDPDGITSLSYSLNGGSARSLNMGSDLRRLADPGDFNADIAVDDFLVGQNTVVFSATNALGIVSTEIVNVEFDNTNVWPLPLTVDWSNAANIQDVAEVLDGYWEIQADGIRSIQMNYDRLVAVGDLTWQDYEVTATITIHDFDPGVFDPNPSGVWAGVGFLLRWPGHVDDSAQPHLGVFPLGAIGWYQIGETATQLEIFGNYADGPVPRVPRNLVFGIPYVFKMRVETIAGVGGLYSFKVWEEAQPEPADWDLTRQEGLQDPQSGSVLLLTHHIDASFGNVTIMPLGN